MALFCRELGRWNYGAFDRGGRLDRIATTGLVSSPRSSGLFGNPNGGLCPGSAGRMGGSPDLESLGIYQEHAEVAGPRYWSGPYCADAHTTAVNLSHRSNAVLQFASTSLVISRKRRNHEFTQSFNIHGGCYGFGIGA